MSRPQLFLVHSVTPLFGELSFSEKLADHNAILQGYIDTHVTRNHSLMTIEAVNRFIKGWFEGFIVKDSNHPQGERQLFVWEAMEPVIGRERIQKFSKGLITTFKSPTTVRTYLGYLRRFFTYVLEWSYIPHSGGTSIVAKYGRLEQPVLEFDYPSHVFEQQEEGFPLVGDKLIEFYDFVRMQYIGKKQKKLTASRDYTAIVLAGETGLRAREIIQLDADGFHRDLFYEEGRIQTRFGKGSKGSGPRVRKTIFTPLLQETVAVYEEHIRPGFRNADKSPAIFLSENGSRISYGALWRSLDLVEKAARQAGLQLPPNFGWHSLRKSFATNYMQRNPDQIWTLMKMLGHESPSTLCRYVKHDQAYIDLSIDSVIQEMLGNLNDEGVT